MNEDNRRLLLNSEDITRSFRRMAHQIWEEIGSDDLALVGIRKRGVTIAKRLLPILNNISGQDIPLGILDIGLYRDDIGFNQIAPEVRSTEIDFDIEGKDIVLIDDVLYTGRTIRAALNALMDLGRPKKVKLLVLVDRGHRELPIQADYVGKSISTYSAETVSVLLQEDDNEEGVYLI